MHGERDSRTVRNEEAIRRGRGRGRGWDGRGKRGLREV